MNVKLKQKIQKVVTENLYKLSLEIEDFDIIFPIVICSENNVINEYHVNGCYYSENNPDFDNFLWNIKTEFDNLLEIDITDSKRLEVYNKIDEEINNFLKQNKISIVII